MAFWHSGILAIWHSSILALWHSGSLALWHSGTLAFWHSATLALQHSCTLALWHSGHSGILALWHSGSLALLQSDTLTLLSYERSRIWETLNLSTCKDSSTNTKNPPTSNNILSYNNKTKKQPRLHPEHDTAEEMKEEQNNTSHLKYRMLNFNLPRTK